MSKYSKFKKKLALDGPLSVGGEVYTRDSLTPGQKGAEAVFDKWFKSKRKYKKPILRIGGGSGSGKAQPDDTVIPTPRGLKRLDELKVGDKVFNLQGKEVPILAIYPQGVQDTYEVTFQDGRTTRCNLDHLWYVRDLKSKSEEFSVLPLRAILDHMKYKGKCRYAIPMPGPVRYRRRWVGVDPYVMGVLLGNGCLSKAALTISSGDMFVPGKVAELIGVPAWQKRWGNYSYVYGYPEDVDETSGRRKLLQTKDVLKDYPELIDSRSHNKFIPDDFKYNSVDNRRRLLQGLLDTDGTINKTNYTVSYSTTSPRLANDITEVARSLGYDARILFNRSTETNPFARHDRYDVFIRCPDKEKIKLFSVKPRGVNIAHKAADHTGYRKNILRITDIQYVGKTPQRCIYIDDPLHVYITENYIPTHNTHFLKYLVDKYGWDRSECYVISYTGQSVNVLRNYGIMSTTIHSAFMIPQEERILDKNGKPIMRRGIPLTSIKFRPVPYIPPSVQLIIVDEASFLPESLEDILRRYNTPILEIGDPIQLPPVGGKQVFHMDNLDYFIEGVMRQNANSEIYQLGTKFRHGELIDIYSYGNEVRFLHQQESIEGTFYQFYPIFKRADLIVTSTNKQRQVITDLYRKEVIGTNSPFPREGEKMICRRNNQTMSIGDFILANGTRGVCLRTVGGSMVDKSTHTYCMDFKPDVVGDTEQYFDNLICDTEFLQQPFGTNSMTSFQHPGEKFEYGHAITTHLIQGGSAPVVIFMDALSRDREYLNRLRYTAVTRATFRLYYMIPYHGEWSL